MASHYQFDDVRITPKPVQKPCPFTSALSPNLDRARRAARLQFFVALFAAAMSYGGLRQVADLYNETCIANGRKPGRLMCSYFTHFCDTPAQEMGSASARSSTTGMRDPGVSRRSQNRSAELPLFHRHGGAAAKGEARGFDGKFGCSATPGASPKS